MNKSFDDSSFNYFGGAVLADSSCGTVSLSNSFGDVLTFRVIDDPEYTMSGFVEPCKRFEGI